MNTPTPTPRPALKATGMRRRHARCLETELAALTTEREVIQNANAHHAERRDAIARAESAEREAFDWKKIARYETARAERAEREVAGLKANNRFQRGHSAGYAEAKADCEAELATERARMADLVADLNDACITLESAKNDCDDYAMQNTAFKLMAVSNVLLQYIPNAAMKEGAK